MTELDDVVATVTGLSVVGGSSSSSESKAVISAAALFLGGRMASLGRESISDKSVMKLVEEA